MCGRFYVKPDDNELEPFFDPDQWVLPGVDLPDESLVRQGEIAPTNVVPVLSLERGVIRPRPMAWGFPKWDGKGVQFNARAETAHTLKSFRSQLANWRVAVPCSGFYEWREEEGKSKKVRYFFANPDGPVLYLAAIAGAFASAKGFADRFCILTTSANKSVKDYHDRMPVTLASSDLETWMGQDYRVILTRVPTPLHVEKG